MRKLPPISTSWPRETITSLSRASARSVITVAAAQLFTAVADSAPVSRTSQPRTRSCRDDRLPVSSASSRFR
jgi:hypothetical protein